MPLGGETVGTAYVRILADGSGLDESIKREFENNDDAIKAAGDRNAKDYERSFRDHMEKRTTRDELRKSIVDAVAGGDYLQDFFKSNNWQEFRKNLRTRFGEAGQVAGKDLERGLAEGMTFDQLRGRLQNLNGEIARAVRDIQARENVQMRNMLDEAYRMNKDYNDKVRRLREEQDRDFERHVQNQANGVERIRRLMEGLNVETEKFVKGQNVGRRSELLDFLAKIRGAAHSAGIDTNEFRNRIDELEKRLRFANPTLERSRISIGRFADTAGRAFGHGSRNNFFNAIGGLVRGVINIGQVVPFVLDKLSDLRQALVGTFEKEFAKSGSAISATLRTIGMALQGGVVGIAALISISLLLFGALGPLVALLGALAGAVIALASTLAFGLVGAVAALIGPLGALGAAIGVITLGFATMTKAQHKALAADFKPLVGAFRELGQAGASTMFGRIAEQTKALRPVIRSLEPLFSAVGASIANIGDYFIRAMHSQGFAAFRDEMTRFLPNAVESLGKSFGNFLGGLGGVFRALTPLANDFLDWLQKITGEFAKWANSPKGQRQIHDFLTKAVESTQSLIHFLEAAGRLLGDLLGSGRKTGNNIFDNMAKGLNNISTYLEKHPGAVQKFFGNVQKTVQDIGQLITQVYALAAAFDTPVTRAIARSGIKLLAGTFRVVSAVLEKMSSGFMKAVGAVKEFWAWAGRLGGLRGILTGIGHVLGQIFNFSPSNARKQMGALVSFFQSMGNKIVAFFRGLPGRILGPIKPMPGRIANVFTGIAPRIANFFIALPGRLRGIFNRLSPIAHLAATVVATAFSGVTHRIGAFLASIPGRVRSILAPLAGIARGAASAVGSAFSGVTGRIGAFLSSIPGRIRGILAPLGGIGRSAASAVANAFSGVVGRIASFFGGVAGAIGSRLRAAVGEAASVASSIVSKFAGLAGRILAAIGNIIIHPHISMPNIPIPTIHPHIAAPGGGLLAPGTAVGGIFEGLRGLGVPRIIGEAGPEAVVPLHRPLSQVDPAVRLLSAFAQGKKMPGMAAGGASPTRTVDASGWTIVTPNTDTRAVAHEVVDTLVAKVV